MKEVLYVRPTITQKSLPEVSEVPISVLLGTGSSLIQDFPCKSYGHESPQVETMLGHSS